MYKIRFALAALFCLGGLDAQTAVDLKTQSKNADFSAASFTKPFRLGASRPATCMVGEAFFQTGVPAGQNVFLCTSSDTWTQQSSGSGGSAGVSAITDLKDCRVTPAGATATVMSPCGIRIGGVVHSLASTSTLTLSGTSANGSVYVYWDARGQLTAAQNTSATLNCDSGCVSVTDAGYPLGSTPIAKLDFSGNMFTTVTDFRVLTSARNILCGTGLVCSENPVSGELTVDTDTASTLLTKATLQAGQTVRCVSASTSNAHSCNLSPSLTSYSNGMALEFVASAAALSGTTTVNVDGLGSRSIKRADGISDPAANQIPAGLQVALRYDGNVFRLPDTGIGIVPGADGKSLISDSGAVSGLSWADRSLAGTAAAIPACTASRNGLIYLFTDSLYSQARCSGSAWTYFFDGRSVTPPSGSWSWDNQTQGGSAALDTSRGFHLLTLPSTHTTGYAVLYQTAPGGSYSRTFAVRWRGLWGSNSTGYMVGFRDSSGKLHGINIQFDSAVNSNFYLLDVHRQASAASTAAVSYDFPRTAVAHLPSNLYLRITDDTTNISFAYSVDGYDFHTLYSGARSAYLSSPSQIFFGAAANAAAMGAALDVISVQ